MNWKKIGKQHFVTSKRIDGTTESVRVYVLRTELSKWVVKIPSFNWCMTDFKSRDAAKLFVLTKLQISNGATPGMVSIWFQTEMPKRKVRKIKS